MADGHVSGEILENVTFENLGNEAHPFMLIELMTVGGHDASALLPPVLERVEAIVSQFCSVRMAVNAENSAIMFGIKLHRLPNYSMNSVPNPAKTNVKRKFSVLDFFLNDVVGRARKSF
jgi:hypothetical protein